MAFALPADRASRPVAVLGAGTLGRRIALVLATRGGTVRLYDPSVEQCAAAEQYVRDTLPHVLAARPEATAGTVDVAVDTAAAVDGAWLVVEAVPEKLELKREVFAELDRLAAPDAILATNSSSYASSLLVERVSRPERVLNTHFAMVPEQNAVEVMSCGRTDRGVLDLMLAVLPEFGVHPFETLRESTGFIYNRIWAAIKRECLAVVAEGVSTPQDVDRLMVINSGAPVGPFRAMDAIGLDVVLDIEEHYAAENPHLPRGPRELLSGYVARGKLGVKTGEGFYDDYPSPLPHP